MDNYGIMPNDSSTVIISKVTTHFYDIVLSLQMWGYLVLVCKYAAYYVGRYINLECKLYVIC